MMLVSMLCYLFLATVTYAPGSDPENEQLIRDHYQLFFLALCLLGMVWLFVLKARIAFIMSVLVVEAYFLLVVVLSASSILEGQYIKEEYIKDDIAIFWIHTGLSALGLIFLIWYIWHSFFKHRECPQK